MHAAPWGRRNNSGSVDSLLIATILWLLPTHAFAYADGDGDSMDDAWELANGLNTTLDDSALDPDLDTFSNLAEYRLGSDP